MVNVMSNDFCKFLFKQAGPPHHCWLSGGSYRNIIATNCSIISELDIRVAVFGSWTMYLKQVHNPLA